MGGRVNGDRGQRREDVANTGDPAVVRSVFGDRAEVDRAGRLHVAERVGGATDVETVQAGEVVDGGTGEVDEHNDLKGVTAAEGVIFGGIPHEAATIGEPGVKPLGLPAGLVGGGSGDLLANRLEGNFLGVG